MEDRFDKNTCTYNQKLLGYMAISGMTNRFGSMNMFNQMSIAISRYLQEQQDNIFCKGLFVYCRYNIDGFVSYFNQDILSRMSLTGEDFNNMLIEFNKYEDNSDVFIGFQSRGTRTITNYNIPYKYFLRLIFKRIRFTENNIRKYYNIIKSKQIHMNVELL